MAVFLSVLGILIALICGFFALVEFPRMSVAAAWAASSVLGWILVGLGMIHWRLGTILGELRGELHLKEPLNLTKEVPSPVPPKPDHPSNLHRSWQERMTKRGAGY